MLTPCPSCRRHVRVGEICPFCGAAPAMQSLSRHALVGRVSRAAVFAGATLAGCSSAPPSPHTPPPAGDPQVIADAAAPPTPLAPIDAGIAVVGLDAGATFAQPPPPPVDAGVVQRVAGKSILRGTIKTPDGQPYNYQGITLVDQNYQNKLQTTTDEGGRYQFDNLAAGEYRLIIPVRPSNPRMHMPPTQEHAVTVGAKQTKRLDVTVKYVAPVDPGPCCKPYGAPPARRRVV